MTAGDLAAALLAAGFDGVEQTDGRLFARAHPSAGEFQISNEASGWKASFAHPVRASGADLASWNARFPNAPLDIHQGETRLCMALQGPGDLMEWRRVLLAMTAKSLDWRRVQRQKDEGM